MDIQHPNAMTAPDVVLDPAPPGRKQVAVRFTAEPDGFGHMEVTVTMTPLHVPKEHQRTYATLHRLRHGDQLEVIVDFTDDNQK